MIVTTINRMARGMDYPSLMNSDQGPVTLASDISSPSTDWQTASYGMSGLGDFTSIGDYFTSANYDLGYVAVVGLAYVLLKKSSSKDKYRRARIKGKIAQEQAML